MNYSKKLLLLIAIATVLRLLFASAIELNADEAYYWTYALKLQWNYFDHPPLVALLIRLTTANLQLHTELFVRLGAIIAAAICTWLMYRIGTLLRDMQTGWYAALLYTASIYASISAGANILPDSPEMIFWLAGIFVLLKIIKENETDHPEPNSLWLLFGLLSGLCIMSKVTGVFLWFGVILFALFTRRDWFKRRGIYLAAVITLIVIFPIIIWNIQNNFSNIKFHGSRVSLSDQGLNIAGFAKAIVQQISINNPIIFVLICINLVLALRGKLPVGRSQIKLLLYCSLPLILVVFMVSLFRETFAHWPAPAYVCLIPLPAIKTGIAGKKQSREYSGNY